MSQFKTRTFVKVINGKEEERIAHTPADAVRYRFNGWAEKRPPSPAKDTGSSAGPGAGRQAKN